MSKARLLSEVSDSPRLDAEILLGFVLDWDRTRLFTWPEHLLSEEQTTSYLSLLTLRQQGRPVAHLIGEREFWSLPLTVNESTLIPRPDTEVLVETVLELDLPDSVTALDLGTGTGAIALALASERKGWKIDAVDFEAAAVQLAEKNRSNLGLSNVAVFQSDWFKSVSSRYDLIVSNPPYIDINDPHLNEGDVRFEPDSALVAGRQGMADIEHIIVEATEYLIDGGWLVLEHGWQQGGLVRAQFEAHSYRDIRTVKDYGGNERVTLARKGADIDGTAI